MSNNHKRTRDQNQYSQQQTPGLDVSFDQFAPKKTSKIQSNNPRLKNYISCCSRRIELNSYSNKKQFIVDFINFIFSLTIVLLAIILRYQPIKFIKGHPGQIYIYDYITIPIRVIILASLICSRCLCNFATFHGQMTRAKAICTLSCFIDLLTTVPPLIVYTLQTSQHNSLGDKITNHLQSIVFMIDMLRFRRMQPLVQYLDNSDVFQIILSLASTLLFFTSGIIVLKEFTSESNEQLNDELFFVMTTVSVIGYGSNIVSVWGRVYVIFTMVVLLISIPAQCAELMNLLSRQSIYSRQRYKVIPSIDHIVVTGKITLISLSDFLQEMFHQDHGQDEKHAVLLLPDKPDQRILSIIQQARFQPLVTYIQGSPQNKKDLKRCSAQKADAIIMLTDKQAASKAADQDSTSILQAMIIKEYLDWNLHGRPHPPICMQMLRPEGIVHFELSANQNQISNQIVCIQRLKLSLMAKSCMCPGLVALISNLIVSMKDPAEDSRFLNLNQRQSWLSYYASGNQHEIYQIEIPFPDHQISFSDLANAVFQRDGIIIFGLQVMIKTYRPVGSKIILLNPGSSFIIPPEGSQQAKLQKLHCYTIAVDQKQAYGIFQTILVVNNKRISFNVLKNAVQRNHIQINGKKRLRQPHPSSQKLNTAYLDDYEEDAQYLQNDKRKRVQSQKGEEESDNQQAEMITSNKISDNRLWMKQCHLTPTKVALQDVTFQTLKDSKLAIDHIIVCGIVNNIIHFVMPLRHKYLTKYQPIVILHTERPVEQWNQLAYFPQIFYVQGNALNHHDLKRVNITKASRVVVLNSDKSEAQVNKNQLIEISETTQRKVQNRQKQQNLKSRQEAPAIRTEEQNMLDAPTIFKYKIVRKAVGTQNPSCFVMTELVSHDNLAFLLDSPLMYDDLMKFGYANTRTFASGAVYLSTMMDALIAQTYFNPNLLTVLNQLLVGETTEMSVNIPILHKLNYMKRSNLFSISIPKQCQGKQFWEFFQAMSMQDIVPFALYRQNIESNNNNNVNNRNSIFNINQSQQQQQHQQYRSQQRRSSNFATNYLKSQNQDDSYHRSDSYYVIICPEKSLVLNQNDYAFVLATQQPDMQKLNMNIQRFHKMKNQEETKKKIPKKLLKQKSSLQLSNSSQQYDDLSNNENDDSKQQSKSRIYQYSRQNSQKYFKRMKDFTKSPSYSQDFHFKSKFQDMRNQFQKKNSLIRRGSLGNQNAFGSQGEKSSQLLQGGSINDNNIVSYIELNVQNRIEHLTSTVTELRKQIKEQNSSLLDTIQKAFFGQVEKEKSKFERQTKKKTEQRRNSKYKKFQRQSIFKKKDSNLESSQQQQIKIQLFENSGSNYKSGTIDGSATGVGGGGGVGLISDQQSIDLVPLNNQIKGLKMAFGDQQMEQ